MTIIPISQENLASFKSIRLRCLQEDPAAFGSTYARESSMSEEEWQRRLFRWSGNRGIGLLSLLEGIPNGIVGVIVSENDAHVAEVVSMWVAPDVRRKGVAATLLSAIEDWARGHDVQTLRLGVTSNNDVALAFYKRYGFSLIETSADNPGVCGCEHTLIKRLVSPQDAAPPR